MLEYLLTGLALLLVFEGLLPALSPRNYRQAMLNMCKMEDRILRSIGLLSMFAGALLLYFFKS